MARSADRPIFNPHRVDGASTVEALLNASKLRREGQQDFLKSLTTFGKDVDRARHSGQLANIDARIAEAVQNQDIDYLTSMRDNMQDMNYLNEAERASRQSTGLNRAEELLGDDWGERFTREDPRELLGQIRGGQITQQGFSQNDLFNIAQSAANRLDDQDNKMFARNREAILTAAAQGYQGQELLDNLAQSGVESFRYRDNPELAVAHMQRKINHTLQNIPQEDLNSFSQQFVKNALDNNQVMLTAPGINDFMYGLRQRGDIPVNLLNSIETNLKQRAAVDSPGAFTSGGPVQGLQGDRNVIPGTNIPMQTDEAGNVVDIAGFTGEASATAGRKRIEAALGASHSDNLAKDSAYNTVYGGAETSSPVTEMTMAETIKEGKRLFALNGGHTPMGAYQIINETRARIAKELYKDGWENVVYSPEVQEEMAKHLYDKVAKTTDLAKTWDALNLPRIRERIEKELGIKAEDINKPGAFANISFDRIKDIIIDGETGKKVNRTVSSSNKGTKEPSSEVEANVGFDVNSITKLTSNLETAVDATISLLGESQSLETHVSPLVTNFDEMAAETRESYKLNTAANNLMSTISDRYPDGKHAPNITIIAKEIERFANDNHTNYRQAEAALEELLSNGLIDWSRLDNDFWTNVGNNGLLKTLMKRESKNGGYTYFRKAPSLQGGAFREYMEKNFSKGGFEKRSQAYKQRQAARQKTRNALVQMAQARQAYDQYKAAFTDVNGVFQKDIIQNKARLKLLEDNVARSKNALDDSLVGLYQLADNTKDALGMKYVDSEDARILRARTGEDVEPRFSDNPTVRKVDEIIANAKNIPLVNIATASRIAEKGWDISKFLYDRATGN